MSSHNIEVYHMHTLIHVDYGLPFILLEEHSSLSESFQASTITYRHNKNCSKNFKGAELNRYKKYRDRLEEMAEHV